MLSWNQIWYTFRLAVASLPCKSASLRQRPPSRLGDLHPRDLDRASAAARNHALAVRSREPSAYKVDHLPDQKVVRPQERPGAAVARSGEQFERAAAVGLGAVATAAGLMHGVVAAVLSRCPKDIRRPDTVRGRTGMPSTARSLIHRR